MRKPLPSAKLDLRLPKELVQKMAPPGTEETHKPKPLLPPMFEEKDDSDFRLNGQLLYRDRELAAPWKGPSCSSSSASRPPRRSEAVALLLQRLVQLRVQRLALPGNLTKSLSLTRAGS